MLSSPCCPLWLTSGASKQTLFTLFTVATFCTFVVYFLAIVAFGVLANGQLVGTRLFDWRRLTLPCRSSTCSVWQRSSSRCTRLSFWPRYGTESVLVGCMAAQLAVDELQAAPLGTQAPGFGEKGNGAASVQSLDTSG